MQRLLPSLNGKVNREEIRKVWNTVTCLHSLLLTATTTDKSDITPRLLFLLKMKKSFPAVWPAALLNCSIITVVVVIIIIIISVDNFRTPSDSHMI